MGDVAQQNGHEGGETGHGGARVSAAAAAEGSDVGGTGRPTCCVCMEPWTCSGAHRICCIPCGHVYGRSCLERWLSRGGSTSAKCPQCSKQFAFEHIINLYAPGNLWDGHMCTRCCIQAPVTSGPSGSETDFLKQVLDIFLEPANIEKEHGLHVDEIIERFKLPERKILDAIMYHVYMGNMYNTIDDFHFRRNFDEDPAVEQTYYQQRVLTFQAQLEEQKRLRLLEDRMARMEADLQRMEADRQRMVAEREAHRQMMQQMFQYMQSLGTRMGLPPPPMLFPPPPLATTPNQSATSNDGPHDPLESW